MNLFELNVSSNIDRFRSFQWPRSKDELKLLTPQSFRWLMEGLATEQKKVIKKSRQKDMF